MRKRPAPPPPKQQPITMVSLNAVLLNRLCEGLEGLVYKVSDTEFCVNVTSCDTYVFKFDSMREALDLIEAGPLGPADDELEVFARMRRY